MASPSILRIERFNYAIAFALVAVGAVTQPKDVVLGLLVGSGLTCLNFFVLRKLIVKWTADAKTQTGSGAASLLMLPKMVGLMGAVAVAVLVLPLDVIAFTIGYSIFIVSIIVESTYTALRPSAADSASENDHG